MTRTRGEWRRATIPLALVLSGVAGMVTLVSVGDLSGQGTGNPGAVKTKSTSSAAREPDLAADLDEAIRILEQGDFRTFLERYAPVEVLRRLRQQDLIERAATVLAGQPLAKQQLLAILKALRKQTPTYDKSRGLATLQFDTLAHGVEEVAGELHLPITDGVKLVGLGGDLTKVMAEAARLLAAGDFQTFVERLFPESELARLQESGAMQNLLQQFQVAPELSKTPPRPTVPKQPTPPVQDSPSLLQSLQADFKLLQTLKPELTEKGQVAVYRIESPDQQPVRIIKFQKTGGDWRLFDDAGRVVAELTRQAKLKPRSAVTTVLMERVGGNWRFIELPALRLDSAAAPAPTSISAPRAIRETRP